MDRALANTGLFCACARERKNQNLSLGDRNTNMDGYRSGDRKRSWSNSTPIIVYIFLVITGLPLTLAYFILSYRALFQENRKRKALYDRLGDLKWRKASYCTVHDQVIIE